MSMSSILHVNNLSGKKSERLQLIYMVKLSMLNLPQQKVEETIQYITKLSCYKVFYRIAIRNGSKKNADTFE